jgi:SAM-dependent methyltransferase
MTADCFQQLLRGFQASRVVLSAIELDLFTAVGEGATAAQIAARLGTAPRATETLLNALTALELLTLAGGLYRNSPFAASQLDGAGAGSGRAAWMHTVNMWDSWSTLTDCVRAGTAVRRRKDRGPDWTGAFIAAMHRNASERAPQLVAAIGALPATRLLDVGGGPATYSIALARANPALTADVLDLPEVLPITRRHIEEAGLPDRIRTRAGDFTSDPLGSGYDLVLLSNVCHILPPEGNLDLLARARDALVEGGHAVIQDFILNDDRTGPLAAALFAVNMLVATEAGSSYSEAEYRDWLARAGLAEIRRVDLPGPASLIIARRT